MLLNQPQSTPSPESEISSVKFQRSPLSLPTTLLLILFSAASYWLAFATTWAAPAILIALPCLCALARFPTPRRAFYITLLTGILIYAPLLSFFYGSVYFTQGRTGSS